MIRYGIYHMFVPAYSTSQSFVLFSVVIFELFRRQMVIPYLFLSGFSTYGSVMIYFGIHSFIIVRMFIVKTICCNFDPLIQLEYISFKMLTDVTVSSGWLRQRVRIRNAMKGVRLTLRHHLRLRRHGKP